MASIPVTLVGSAYLTGVGVNPLAAVPVTIVADLTYTGLGVGGGPIIPPEQPPQQPPGQPPHPAFPIWGPPGTNWPNKPGYPPYVDISPPGPQPPTEPPTTEPPQPPLKPVYGWTPGQGWFVVWLPTPETPVVTPSEQSAPQT